MQKVFEAPEIALIPAVFGPFDENAGIIESELGIHLVNRDDHLILSGEESNVDQAAEVLKNLF